MTDIEIKINIIKRKIADVEEADFVYLNKGVQQLRHDVLYLHTSLEATIDKKIIQYFLKSAGMSAQDIQKKVDFSHNFRMILNEMDFSKKLKVVEVQKLLPKEIISKFFKVNDLRVHFAHPTSYRSKLILYQHPKKMLGAYEILSDVLVAMEEAGINDRPLTKIK